MRSKVIRHDKIVALRQAQGDRPCLGLEPGGRKLPAGRNSVFFYQKWLWVLAGLMRRRNEECLFTWCGGKSGGIKQGKGNEMGVVSWEIGFLLLVRCRKLVHEGLWKGGTGWRQRGVFTIISIWDYMRIHYQIFHTSTAEATPIVSGFIPNSI